jgi:predicted naringenin-chalcone synthase
MMTAAPAILTLATGVPDQQYTQAEIADQYIQWMGYPPRRARALSSIFERSGVAYRHMVVDEHYFNRERTTQARNEQYMAEAVPLGARTIQQGLARACCKAQDIDDLIVVSCTGFQIPGLDLLLAAQLGMRPDLQRSCILGMGCYGAFPGLLRARQAASSEPGRRALVLALELCSLHLQFDDSAETAVSTSLFADGAAMALVGEIDGREHGRPQPRLIHSATHCSYTTLEHMSFNLTDHGFRMSLSSYVPDLLASEVETVVDNMLGKAGLCRNDVRFWGIHPGSTKIIDHVQQRLGLRDEQVESSHQILHHYGNMSSATILFVLDRIQECENPSPGDYGVLLAFGPGLTIEGLIVQW